MFELFYCFNLVLHLINWRYWVWAVPILEVIFDLILENVARPKFDLFLT